MAKERVKRGAGRPRAVARAIDPDEIQRIADWRLQGCSLSEIALRLGVHRSTVQHHLKAIGHEWQVGHNVDRAEQLAKVNLMERVAWERFEQSMKPQTRKQLKFDLAKDLKAKNVDAAEARRLVEEVVTRTTRTGEPAWLGVIQWCRSIGPRFSAGTPRRNRRSNIARDIGWPVSLGTRPGIASLRRFASCFSSNMRETFPQTTSETAQLVAVQSTE